MKKIINGKMYNTETATFVGIDSYSYPSDFNWWEEELYKKKTGEFFLYGKGGAMSRYSEACGQNSWCGGSQIVPLSTTDARLWAEKHLTADEYESIFGPAEE